jgi:cytochrome P450
MRLFYQLHPFTFFWIALRVEEGSAHFCAGQMLAIVALVVFGTRLIIHFDKHTLEGIVKVFSPQKCVCA